MGLKSMLENVFFFVGQENLELGDKRKQQELLQQVGGVFCWGRGGGRRFGERILVTIL